jgi:hypothetical protein
LGLGEREQMSSPKHAISEEHLVGAVDISPDASQPCHDDIAQLAYHLWESRQQDGAEGSPDEDWLEAERRLQQLAHREPV